MSHNPIPPLRDRLPLSVWCAAAMAARIESEGLFRRILTFDALARNMGAVVIGMNRTGFAALATHDARSYTVVFSPVRSGKTSPGETVRFVMMIKLERGRAWFSCKREGHGEETLAAQGPFEEVGFNELSGRVLQNWVFAATSFAVQNSASSRTPPGG